MKIILSEQCASLTGALGKGYGYAVRKHIKGFYGYRNSRGFVPPDGHLRFIIACAKLAQARTHIVDIQLPEREFRNALTEADIYGIGPVGTYNAKRVIELMRFYSFHNPKLMQYYDE